MAAFTVAAVQAAYVLMDRDATIDRVAELTAEARQRRQARRVSWRPSCPATRSGRTPASSGTGTRRGTRCSSTRRWWCPARRPRSWGRSPGEHALPRARRHRARPTSATIYCTVLYFGPDGSLARQAPQADADRLRAHGLGHGRRSTLTVLDTGSAARRADLLGELHAAGAGRRCTPRAWTLGRADARDRRFVGGDDAAHRPRRSLLRTSAPTHACGPTRSRPTSPLASRSGPSMPMATAGSRRATRVIIGPDGEILAGPSRHEQTILTPRSTRQGPCAHGATSTRPGTTTGPTSSACRSTLVRARLSSSTVAVDADPGSARRSEGAAERADRGHGRDGQGGAMGHQGPAAARPRRTQRRQRHDGAHHGDSLLADLADYGQTARPCRAATRSCTSRPSRPPRSARRRPSGSTRSRPTTCSRPPRRTGSSGWCGPRARPSSGCRSTRRPPSRIDETIEPRPESSYSLSKLVGETMATQFARRTGIPIVGLRISNIMEPDDYARFPSYWDDALSAAGTCGATSTAGTWPRRRARPRARMTGSRSRSSPRPTP